jgi:hypothetical protein
VVKAQKIYLRQKEVLAAGNRPRISYLLSQGTEREQKEMSRNTTPWEEYEQESCLFSTVGGNAVEAEEGAGGREGRGGIREKRRRRKEGAATPAFQQIFWPSDNAFTPASTPLGACWWFPTGLKSG